MTSSIHGSPGTGISSSVGVGHEGDSVVKHGHRAITTIKVTEPGKIAELKEMFGKLGHNVDESTVVAKSHEKRTISAAEVTCSLKAESGSTPQELAELDRGIEPDEGIVANFEDDTGSVIDDRKSDTSSEVDVLDRGIDPDEGIFGDVGSDTSSVFDDLESDTQSEIDDLDMEDFELDEDADIERTDPDSESMESAEEGTEHVSLKERLTNVSANVSQKAKTLGKSIKDWVISLPNRVLNKMPRKVADAFVLHAPSPKALKERVIGKIANPSNHMLGLSSERLQDLSRPGGPSAHADDDQLAAVKENIESTETERQSCKQELKELPEHFDTKDALQRREQLKQKISTLSLDLKSYQLAEKMLLKMIKPVADKLKNDQQVEKRTDYDSKADAFKQQGKVLDTKLVLLEKDYADLKSSLNKNIKALKKDIKTKEAEIKTLQNKMEKVDSEEKEVENPFVYLGGVAVHYDEVEKMLEDKQNSLQAQRDKLDKIQDNIAAKKQEMQDVKDEQAKRRKDMREDKNAFERSINSLKKDEK